MADGDEASISSDVMENICVRLSNNLYDEYQEKPTELFVPTPSNANLPSFVRNRVKVPA